MHFTSGKLIVIIILMDDEFDKNERAFRLKQEQCIHPSWVCTCCHLHKDHYQYPEQLYIKKLESKITEYESILTSLGFLFSKCELCSENGIIISNTVHICITDTEDEPTKLPE